MKNAFSMHFQSDGSPALLHLLSSEITSSVNHTNANVRIDLSFIVAS